jgi:hypothetical protein
VIVSDSRLRPWIEERLHMKMADDAQYIGRIVDGNAVCVVAFSNWCGCDIELSVAADPGSGSRLFLSVVFSYVFGQLGCVRCTVKTRASNADGIHLAERLGFEREGYLRNGFGNEDAVLLGLLKGDLNGKYQRTPIRSRSDQDHRTGKPIQPDELRQPVREQQLDDGRERPRDEQHHGQPADARRD